MARQVQTKLIDDLDESEASSTVRFGYEGGEYEIDLNEEHLQAFEEFLAPYIEHGRRVRDGQGRRQRRAHEWGAPDKAGPECRAAVGAGAGLPGE